VIAKRLGYSRAKITTTQKALVAEKRAHELGVDLDGAGEEAKAAISNLTLDKSFLGAVELTKIAGLQSPKVKALVKELVGATSEEAADDVLRVARVRHEHDIEAVASGAKSGRPNLLALGLGAIVKVDPDTWQRPVDSDKALVYRSQIEQAVAVLSKIREKLA
jgi:hypothetical protein